MSARVKSMHRLHLNILLIPEGTGWVAQAIQHDFAGQGPTQRDALRALAHTIGCHIFVTERKGVTGDPLANVPAAPDEYWTRFEQAAKRAMEAMELDPMGLPAFVIKAIADQEPRVNY